MTVITIRPPHDDGEVRAAAKLMATSEPWITLKRDVAQSYQSLAHPDKEVFLAIDTDRLVGLIVINMHGVLAGYIQSICVAEGWRGQGIGTTLIDHAEQRIFREAPNAFLLVSSFNHAACKLYKRLGYEQVGEIPDFIVQGHSELILRKSIAPLAEYHPAGN